MEERNDDMQVRERNGIGFLDKATRIQYVSALRVMRQTKIAYVTRAIEPLLDRQALQDVMGGWQTTQDVLA